MATWGVLRLPAGADAASGAGEGAVAASVAGRLDGLVAVAEDTTTGEVLALLPAQVTRVVELDAATATDPGGGEAIAGLLAADDGTHAAVVAAVPMADALKRVADGTLVEGLARDGLLAPARPMVFDRAALHDLPEGPGDAVSGLLRSGRTVLAVPRDGAPLTLRSEAAS